MNFTYSNDHKLLGATIVPMLLITFVENALKYGVSTSVDTVIDIALKLENGFLTLTTSNPIHVKPKDENREGIGIENSRKRLDLVYSNNYSLDINETDDQFDVKLSINLNHHKP